MLNIHCKGPLNSIANITLSLANIARTYNNTETSKHPESKIDECIDVY